MARRIGRYYGDLSVKRLASGHYVVTGPRGEVEIVRSVEPVYVRSWARSRTVKRTVWSPTRCTAELNMWHEAPTWKLTLREAIGSCISALCNYK